MDIAIFLYLMGFLTYFRVLMEECYFPYDFAVVSVVSLIWPLIPVLEGLETLWLYITGKL